MPGLSKLAKKLAEVTVEKAPLGMYEAKVGKKVVGKAYPWEDSSGNFVMQNVRVSPNYRNRGVGRALYSTIEQQTGRQLSPAVSLSDDAFEFWKRYRPEAVAQDLRHRPELPGQRVKLPDGRIGVIKSASGKGAMVELGDGRSTSYLRGADIDAAIEAAKQGYAKGGSVKTDRNAFVGWIADQLEGAKSGLDAIPMPLTSGPGLAALMMGGKPVTTAGVTGMSGIGEMALGEMPEEIGRWAEGDYPMQRIPATYNERGRPTGDSGRLKMKDERIWPLIDVVAGLGGAAEMRRGLTGAASVVNTPENIERLQGVARALGVPESGATTSNVIKQKGGNYLTRIGSPPEAKISEVDRVLEPLRFRNRMSLRTPADQLKEIRERYTPEALDAMDPDVAPIMRANLERSIPKLTRQAASDDWLDRQLGKYIRNEMATPEDPVRLMADAWPAKKAEMLAQKQAQIDKATAAMTAEMNARGLTPAHMTKSQAQIRDLMLEKQLIENQEALHANPNSFGVPRGYIDEPARYPVGDLRRLAGLDPTGMAQTRPAKVWETATDRGIDVDSAGNILLGPDAGSAKFSNPWLAKVPPLTKVYRPHADLAQKLNFEHLRDELINAMEPTSGIPAALQLDPANLGKITVPQAIEHVAKINAWRKQQADMARRGMVEGIPRLKAYDSGHFWTEVPDVDADPAHMEYVKSFGCEGGWCTQGEDNARSYGSRGNKIHILHDPSGAPRAQIATRPPHRVGFVQGRMPDDVDQMFRDYEAARELDPAVGDITPAAWWRAGQGIPEPVGLPSIAEIKGRFNDAPDPEDLPMIQDFVRSRPWSTVGDFENTGLYLRKNLPAEEQAMLPDAGDYLTMDELQKLREGRAWTPLDDRPEFAEGGAVDTDDDLIEEYAGRAMNLNLVDDVLAELDL